MTEDSFGRRLRRERERRQIALSSISANTKISATLFAALERDDVSRWPSGIFRRAFIRAYAEGVGLDPDELTREFLECFPDPADPPPAAEPAPPAQPARVRGGALRLTFANVDAPFEAGRLLADMRRRWTAVGCDAAIVLAIAVSVFVASGDFWAPLAVTALAYYSAGILLLGNSPGVRLCAEPPRRAAGPTGRARFSSRIRASTAGFLGRINRTAWTRQVWRTFRTHV